MSSLENKKDSVNIDISDDPVEKELNDIDRKIDMLSNIANATTVNDVGVVSVDNLKDMIADLETTSQTLGPSPSIGANSENSESEEQLRKIILERFRNADPEVKNNIVNKIANLKKINPDNRSFTTVNETKRQTLLKKLHERRGQLGMRRKPKHILEKMNKDLQNQISMATVDSNKEENTIGSEGVSTVVGQASTVPISGQAATSQTSVKPIESEKDSHSSGITLGRKKNSYRRNKLTMLKQMRAAADHLTS